MPEPEDIHWLRSTANDLNNLLQVIAESSHVLAPLCQAHPEGRKYLSFLRAGLDRATNVTSQLVSRLGGLPEADSATPSATASAATAPAQQPEQKAGSAASRPGLQELILIVDDEAVVADLAQQMLAGAGYRVLVAHEPFKALEIFRQKKGEISLVMLDFTLPIMDGSEVFDELRKIRSDAPVMLSSGFAEQDKLRAMLAKGLRGFLPKPYSKEKLLAQVRSTLDTILAEKASGRRAAS